MPTDDHQNEQPPAFFRARLKATGVEGWARRVRIFYGIPDPADYWNFTSDDERTACQVHRDRLAFLEPVE